MSSSLEFSPLLPLTWIVILCALGLLGSLWAGWHRPLWLVLRIGLIIGLVLFASGIQKIESKIETLSDIALVLVDDTLSMNMAKRAEIRDNKLSQLRELAKADPDLDLLEVPITDSPDGTRLFEAMTSGLAQIPSARLAGIVAITDGIIHDTAPAITAKAPVHSLIIGDPSQKDRSLTIIEAPKFGIVGEQVQFKIRVDEFGDDKTGSAKIVLRLAGEPELRTRVQTGIDVNVQMPLSRRGSNLVEIQVEAAEQELTLLNNKVAVEVTGVRERLRVLLVSGEPYPGVRAWRNLLKSDPAVDLVHFTILRPPTKRDLTPLNEMALIAFPTRELFVEKLKSFDLIIFDRYTRRGVLPLLYLQNVTQYVEEGGALMVAAGPPFAGNGSLARTFLAGLLPARPDGNIHTEPFRAKGTDIGARHPVTAPLLAQQEKWGRWGRVIGVTGVRGETVLSASEDKPLLILDRVGAGRVALLLSDQAWLWSRGFEGGGPQYELYRRLAHWLMKEPELEEESLQGEIRDGQLYVRLRTLQDKPPPIEVTGTQGKTWSLETKQVSPGLYSASMNVPESEGLLTLSAGELLAVAAQGRLNPPEFARLQPVKKALEPLNKQTRGGAFFVKNLQSDLQIRRTRPQDRQAGRNWFGLQQNKFHIKTQIKKRPLIDPRIALIFLLLLTGSMWWRESKTQDQVQS